MPRRIQTNTIKANAALAAALLLAAAALWLYRAGAASAGMAAAAGALLTCCIVLALCIPQVFRWSQEKRPRLPWLARLTGEGLAIFLALLFLAAAAAVSGNNLLYLILSVMLAASALSGVVSRLSLAELSVRVFAQEHVFAGKPFDVEVRIENRKRRMPSFAVELGPAPRPARGGVHFSRGRLPLLPAGEEVLTRIECRFDRRGVYRNPAFLLSTKFPFSMIERRLRVELRREIVVYPRIDAPADIDKHIRAIDRRAEPAAGTSHDLYRIRPAAIDDGARFIGWKATARSGDLQVKEFHRRERRRVTLVFNPRGYGGGEEFEAAVNRCAALLYGLWERGVEVLFRCGGFETSAAPRSGGIYACMRFLATLEADGEAAGASGKTAPAKAGEIVIAAADPLPRAERQGPAEG